METEDLFAELGVIAQRLDALGDHDHDERIRLLTRRRDLHRAAGEIANDPSDPVVRARLRNELQHLEERWLALQRERIDVVKQAGDLAAGNFGFTADAMRLNRAIDKAGGRESLETRIHRLRALLESGGD